MVLAAEIWHYWIGVALVLGALAAVLALVVGYLVKVERPRYPKHGQEVPVPGAEPGK
jgi:hypothetical protein